MNEKIHANSQSEIQKIQNFRKFANSKKKIQKFRKISKFKKSGNSENLEFQKIRKFR